MQTIYLDSPEGNRFYITGVCITRLQQMHPDKKGYIAAVKNFIERAQEVDFNGLLLLVEEVSLGTICFLEGGISQQDSLLSDTKMKTTCTIGMQAMGMTLTRGVEEEKVEIPF